MARLILVERPLDHSGFSGVAAALFGGADVFHLTYSNSKDSVSTCLPFSKSHEHLYTNYNS